MSDDLLLEPTEGEEQINLDDLDVKHVLDDDEDELKEIKEETNDTFEDDLFDAAIEPSINDEKPTATATSNNENSTVSNETKQISTSSFSTPSTVSLSNTNGSSNNKDKGGKKFCCYVGNMTWWTTDADLTSMIQACEIEDIIDIRFYENRQNGQSKGFALVVLGSDASVKTLMEKLPSKPINGQSVQVLGYSKANLDKLDGQSRKNDTRAKQTTSQSDVTAIRIDGTTQPTPVGGAVTSSIGIPGLVGMIRAANNTMQTQSQQPLTQFSQPPPTIRPTIIQPQQQQQLPNFMRPPPTVQIQTQPMMNRPPPGFSQPPPTVGGSMMNVPPPMIQNQTGMGMGMQQMGGIQNGFVMNQPQHYQMHHFNAPPPQMDMEQPLSNHEFEEIMSRNHTVSSSAISRAVSDAATGDYRSAIETLLTAISLIKQSRVAKHDRCKALISSLEDTVRGIEAKHYSRKHHRRSRSRSRSPDRRSKRRRSRSRSRERYDYDRRSRY
uniref:RRM domain-containing protein n=1 Tax=Panagrolaimus sp. PS1159 TaxID=55785 RepID=A0AC35EZS6_9BILA